MKTASLKVAKRMRHAPAGMETALWKLLRNRRLEGLKFRRQAPLGSYVADFVCYRHRLIIEADGYYHDAVRDERRDHWLAGQGFRVLRFKNTQIDNHGEQVLQSILDAVKVPPFED